jgi:hypothetical protein
LTENCKNNSKRKFVEVEIAKFFILGNEGSHRMQSWMKARMKYKKGRR